MSFSVQLPGEQPTASFCCSEATGQYWLCYHSNRFPDRVPATFGDSEFISLWCVCVCVVCYIHVYMYVYMWVFHSPIPVSPVHIPNPWRPGQGENGQSRHPWTQDWLYRRPHQVHVHVYMCMYIHVHVGGQTLRRMASNSNQSHPDYVCLPLSLLPSLSLSLSLSLPPSLPHTHQVCI